MKLDQTSIFNQALTKLYIELLVVLSTVLGLFLLGAMTKFAPLLSVLLIVQLIKLVFVWFELEDLKSLNVNIVILDLNPTTQEDEDEPHTH